jgi:hypothetical protein
LDQAFSNSPDFSVSNAYQPGTLVVYIPSNVIWTQDAMRGKASYTVEFSLGDGRSQSLDMDHVGIGNWRRARLGCEIGYAHALSVKG